MITLYRKKPMAVEVMQFLYTGDRLLELSEWMGANMKTSGKARHKDAKGYLEVMTLADGKVREKLLMLLRKVIILLKAHLVNFGQWNNISSKKHTKQSRQLYESRLGMVMRYCIGISRSSRLCCSSCNYYMLGIYYA